MISHNLGEDICDENNLIKKWTKDYFFYKHFTKEYVQMARRSMKRCSALLAISKMSIKTKVKY